MLPLTSVSFNQFITFEEVVFGKDFPPPRFDARNERFRHLNAIYESDFSNFVEPEDDELIAIPTGLSRRTVDAFVEIMLMSEPESPYPLRQIAADCIRDMLTYGGGIILGVYPEEGDPYLQIVNPDTWYPLEDTNNIVIFEPFTSTSATTSQPDMVKITTLEDGILTENIHTWTSVVGKGRIGTLHSSGFVGEANVFYSPKSPVNGVWGESMFSDIAGPLFEITKRVSQNSRVLDANVEPLLLASMTEQDAINRFAADETDTNEQNKKIIEALKGVRKQEAAVLPKGMKKFDYLEYGGNLSASMDQLKVNREILSNHTGLPGVYEAMQNNPVSGRALIFQFLPFFAKSSSMQKDATEVLSDAVDYIMPGNTVTWPHVFETFGEEETNDGSIEGRVSAGISGG